MSGLTLRQIEVVRAVMISGTINGAASLLNVSAPGISRLLKHTETSLGIRLFERRGGVFIPASEAQAIFDQINAVYEKVEGLEYAFDSLKKGRDAALAFGSVPSIAQFIVARAVVHVRRKFPDLYIDLNVLKIEEAVDYLLLERGELVAMSYFFEHPSIDFIPLGTGELVVIVPDEHPLAAQSVVSVQDLAQEAVIGMDTSDPYGAIMARPFQENGLDYRLSIRARFAQTVVSLVRHGLGVAVIDEFSVAGVYMPGLTRVTLQETTEISAYAAVKRGRVISSFADYTIGCLKKELQSAVSGRPWEQAVRARK